MADSMWYRSYMSLTGYYEDRRWRGVKQREVERREAAERRKPVAQSDQGRVVAGCCLAAGIVLASASRFGWALAAFGLVLLLFVSKGRNKSIPPAGSGEKGEGKKKEA